jgi:hypothetical protein
MEAQRRFVAFGGGEGVRRDASDFELEPAWRPVAGDRYRFEPRGGPLAPWPDDRTVLYWWRCRPGSTWWDSVMPVEVAFADDADPRAGAFRDAVSDVN